MADGGTSRPVATAVQARFDDALRTCLEAAGTHHPAKDLFTALSGGPDSTALACLAQAYATRHGLRHTALIVDHRIRDDSTAEAHLVAANIRRSGVVAASSARATSSSRVSSPSCEYPRSVMSAFRYAFDRVDRSLPRCIA